MTTSAEWGKMRNEKPSLADELLEGAMAILREERDEAKLMKMKLTTCLNCDSNGIGIQCGECEQVF